MGFNNFRSVSIKLVKKINTGYLVLYNFESDATDRGITKIIFPSDLKYGSDYALKVSVHNINEAEVSDYSDGTFTINTQSISTCTNPSLAISPDPLVSPNGSILGSYDVFAGGGDCTVIIKSIQFKANIDITSWHTQFTDVTTSQNNNILTLTFPDTMQLFGRLVNMPNGLHSEGSVIDMWGSYNNPVPQGTNIVNPVSIDAVDVNGTPIANITGLK